MPLYFLTEQDRRLIQSLLEEKRRASKSQARAAAETLWRDAQAPEVYIAKPVSEDGIPGLTPAAGTGSGDFAEPGEGPCDIYQILQGPAQTGTGDAPQLHPVGIHEKTVYNLQSGALPQDWMPVWKTKFGKWLGLGTPEAEIILWELTSGMTYPSTPYQAAYCTAKPVLFDSDTGTYQVDEGASNTVLYHTTTFRSTEAESIGRPVGVPAFHTCDWVNAFKSADSERWEIISRPHGIWRFRLKTELTLLSTMAQGWLCDGSFTETSFYFNVHDPMKVWQGSPNAEEPGDPGYAFFMPDSGTWDILLMKCPTP